MCMDRWFNLFSPREACRLLGERYGDPLGFIRELGAEGDSESCEPRTAVGMRGFEAASGSEDVRRTDECTASNGAIFGLGITNRSAGVGLIGRTGPFEDIAVHVVETPRGGFQHANFDGRRGTVIRPPPIMTQFFGVVAEAESGFGSRSAGVFSF